MASVGEYGGVLVDIKQIPNMKVGEQLTLALWYRQGRKEQHSPPLKRQVKSLWYARISLWWPLPREKLMKSVISTHARF